MKKDKTRGVLLVNTGTPEEPVPDAVRVYLKRFLSHPRIRPMNRLTWSSILNLFILPMRGVASAAKYREIWTDEGSPFTIAHERLTKKLAERLHAQGKSAELRCAMSFGKPLVADALAELRGCGCDELTVLPLYPQSAYSTTGVVRDDVEQALREMQWQVPCCFVDDYHADAAYIRAIANSIMEAGFDASPGSSDRLMLAFHSIPMNDIAAGDSYGEQTTRTSQLVANELGLPQDRVAIAYQCRFDKSRKWLEPYAKDVLADEAVRADGRLFYVCPGFSVDCLETLYDIKVELEPFYRAKLAEAGKTAMADSFVYVYCLNSSNEHVDALTGVLASVC